MGIIKIIAGKEEDTKETAKICKKLLESEEIEVKEINHKCIFEPYEETEISILYTKKYGDMGIKGAVQ